MSEGIKPPEIGTYLAPHLCVLRTIGSGGMGIVLLAHDEMLARDVAVKLVHSQLLDEYGQALFLEEARAMARVRHVNVVEIFSFGEHRKRPYFTMEFISGPSLEEYHAKGDHGPLPLDEALGILRDVARGIDAIHASGTIHGDLKPANILLSPKFRPRVTDFGLTLDVSKGKQAFLGTPHYVAPERLQKTNFDPQYGHRIDIYAFGVLTYQLLTGMLPFDAPDPGRIYAQHLYKKIPKASDFRPDLPKSIDMIIESALVKTPRDRTDRASDIVDALEQIRRQMKPSHRVLIADDEPAFRRLLRMHLEDNLNIKIIEEVDNGTDALKHLATRHFDLIIIDLHMPQMNGLELTASIREKIPQTDLPIVVVSGHGTASDWQVLSRLGADAFVVKPLELDVFLSTVEQLLYGSRLDAL